MERKFTGSETVGEIVTAFPGASNLMKEYKIDFCCGGNRPLSEALRQKGIDEKTFLEKLNQLHQQALQKQQQNVDWRKAPLGDLIDHIVQNHHAYLLKELPLLSEFVTKIFRVHGAAHDTVHPWPECPPIPCASLPQDTRARRPFPRAGTRGKQEPPRGSWGIWGIPPAGRTVSESCGPCGS